MLAALPTSTWFAARVRRLLSSAGRPAVASLRPQRRLDTRDDANARGASGTHGTRANAVNASLFDVQLRQCLDSASVLRTAATSALRLRPADLAAFFRRLQAFRAMPKSGSDLHKFVEKVSACLEHCDKGQAAETGHFAMLSFADLRCRQGSLAAWSFLVPRLNALGPGQLAQSIWAISLLPNPTREVRHGANCAAETMAPRIGELSDDTTLYRSVYGLARISRGRGCDEFRTRMERTMLALLQRRPCVFSPERLVRLLWSFGRLGFQDYALFDALEPWLRRSLLELSDKELQATYRVLTELELQGQWRLIHDVEVAMESRQEAQDPNKQRRKQPFRNKWMRIQLTDSVLPERRR